MKKAEVRELYKKKRFELSPNELEDRSEAICNLLFQHFQLAEKTISLFLPIERHKEINTYLILEKGMTLDSKIALPKMNVATQTLKHLLYESQSQLETNSFGVPEPRFGKSINIKDVEIVLVPLLGIDSKGNRVGYGKGYYDKFLKKCTASALFIGLHLFDEYEVIDDVEPFDVRLHYCVTPSKVIRFEE